MLSNRQIKFFKIYLKMANPISTVFGKMIKLEKTYNLSIILMGKLIFLTSRLVSRS